MWKGSTKANELDGIGPASHLASRGPIPWGKRHGTGRLRQAYGRTAQGSGCLGREVLEAATALSDLRFGPMVDFRSLSSGDHIHHGAVVFRPHPIISLRADNVGVRLHDVHQCSGHWGRPGSASNTSRVPISALGTCRKNAARSGRGGWLRSRNQRLITQRRRSQTFHIPRGRTSQSCTRSVP
jgi:hypothetical protein